MQASKKGAAHELVACAYFIAQGYEVFRNVAPTGPADLVIWNPETSETILVDVKSPNRRIDEFCDTIYSCGVKDASISAGVKYLVVHEGVVMGFAPHGRLSIPGPYSSVASIQK